MTQEEKAKRYDEVIERLKDFRFEYRFSGFGDVIEEKFPELAESEDERIRKSLSAYFSKFKPNDMWNDEFSFGDIVSWFEAQGEHANFRNKIQLGDKVTRNEDGVLVNLSQLNRVAKKDEKQGEQRPLYSQEVMDIAIAKDFEQDELKPVFDIKTSEESLSIDSDAHNNIVDECIYNEQKTSWSEEDKKMLEYAINMIEWYSVVDKSKSKRVSDWLKFLKDRVQPQQEWSEEDEKMWAEVSDMLWEGYKQSDSNLFWDDIKSWVKPKIESPKPQLQWKPSDEQMQQLGWIAKQNKDNIIGKELMSLYQDLKKLRKE